MRWALAYEGVEHERRTPLRSGHRRPRCTTSTAGASATRPRSSPLEDLSDRHAGPCVRRLVWRHILEDRDAVVDSLRPNAGATWRRVMRTLLPVAKPVVRPRSLTPLPAPPGREFSPPHVVAAVLELRTELDAGPGGRWIHDMFARRR